MPLASWNCSLALMGLLKVMVLQSTDMGNFNGKIDGDASGFEFQGDKQD